MDVSFISATLVLPAVIAAAFPESPEERRGRQMVVLVKPQFEVGRGQVGKGGIVRDDAAQQGAIEKVRLALLAQNCIAYRCDRIPDSRRGRESRVPAIFGFLTFCAFVPTAS